MISIHPHRGYLNTPFYIYSNDESQHFSIFYKDSTNTSKPIKTGSIHPNTLNTFNLDQSGQFIVVFEDGSSFDISVEDGYKFGGSSFKTAFVFDICPWSFIIMHDRTYFYNRDTGESYVEPISPDKIIEISQGYVLFENNGHVEQTLYSLIDQKPILSTNNIKYFSPNFLIWINSDKDNIPEFVLYSLTEKQIICKAKYDHLSIDNNNKKLFYVNNNELYTIDLNLSTNVFRQKLESFGNFVAFAQVYYAVFINSKEFSNEIIIFNLISKKEEGRITSNNTIARINDNEFINLNKRKHSIYNFNLAQSDFPEATISAKYSEYDIFPCDWNIFYIESSSVISTKQKCIKTSFLKSASSNLCEVINRCDKTFCSTNYFCIHDNKKTIVIPRRYNYIFTNENCEIFNFNNTIILKQDNSISYLSRNGFWDNKSNGNFELKYYNDYGIIYDKDTYMCNNNLGKYITFDYHQNCIKTEKAFVFKGGKRIYHKTLPPILSPCCKYGLNVTKKEVLFFSLTYNGYTSQPILTNFFDCSYFSDVLLSEDGDSLMYRNNNETIVLDINTGKSDYFKNLSYINHFNGIRPTFKKASSLQPRLIDPVTKQYIDTELMTKYQFISPDGRLYADTNLDKYTEYIDLESNKNISREKFDQLINLFNYPFFCDKDDETYIMAQESRKKHIRDHFDFFNKKHPTLVNNDPFGEKWAACLLECSGWQFIRYFIEIRGVAIIRDFSNQSEVARIPLGEPLSYINYVSFSYDSKYVALAGFRGNGVFLLYDLNAKRTIFNQETSRAVWSTAFSLNGILAAYTSDPFTFLFPSQNECDIEMISKTKIDNRNFLTFSPDGNLFALSNQEYISKYNINGEEQLNWGHQPSTLIEIRFIDEPDIQLMQFSDLSNIGIEGTQKNIL